MKARALIGGLLVVAGLLAWQAARDPAQRTPPAPVELPAASPEGPQLPPVTEGLLLRGAGVVVHLPEGFRVRPLSVGGGPGRSQARASGHGVVAAATFYADGATVFRKTYEELARRLPTPVETRHFLGGSKLLTRWTREAEGGRFLVFELEPDVEGFRETLVVGIPARGEGLATVQLRYPFRPSTARMILRTIERMSFEPAPAEG